MQAITKIVNEVVYLLVCLIFLLFHIFGLSLPEEKRDRYFGLGLISVIGFGILVNILLGLLGFILMITEKCRRRKDGAKIHPEKMEESKAVKDNYFMEPCNKIDYLAFSRSERIQQRKA